MSFSNNQNNNATPAVIVINRETGITLGVIAFIFGFISIFVMAPVFVPLSVVFGTLAIIKRQFVLGLTGLICGFIGFFTSPVLLGLAGVMTLGALIEPKQHNTDAKPLTESPSLLSMDNRNLEGLETKPMQDETNKVPAGFIQTDLKAGPVSIKAFSKCSPLLNNCEENYAQLYYGDDVVKIDSTGTPFHPLAADEVKYVDGQFVTILSANGGNCDTCEGIQVIAVENGKLTYLGKFSSIEKGRLIKVYDELEYNELTSHGEAPRWYLYYKVLNGKLILDFDETCERTKYYDRREKALLDVLSTNGDAKQKAASIDENSITAELLGITSIARYCGWRTVYEKIIMAARDANRVSNPIVSDELLQNLSSALLRVKPATSE